MDVAIPDPWHAIVLAFGCYRITRFLGWDDWPPILRVRQWAIGERWVTTQPVQVEFVEREFSELTEARLERTGITQDDLPAEAPDLGLPGKQPPSEVSDVRPAYDRPTLAHLVHCPFCLGWWVSLAAYASWNLTPAWTLWLIAPFALSGAVGLLARNLDP